MFAIRTILAAERLLFANPQATASTILACATTPLAVPGKHVPAGNVTTAKKVQNVIVRGIRFRTATAVAIRRMIPATRIPAPQKCRPARLWMKLNTAAAVRPPHALREKNAKI